MSQQWDAAGGEWMELKELQLGTDGIVVLSNDYSGGSREEGEIIWPLGPGGGAGRNYSRKMGLCVIWPCLFSSLPNAEA